MNKQTNDLPNVILKLLIFLQRTAPSKGSNGACMSIQLRISIDRYAST